MNEEYTASLSSMSTTGIISLSEIGCFPGRSESAFGTAGAVVALTLGASVVGLNVLELVRTAETAGFDPVDEDDDATVASVRLALLTTTGRLLQNDENKGS